MALSKNLPKPTEYVTLMNGEFGDWALNEERAPPHRGRWRSEVFKTADDHPIDLEIGTGNGYHFAHLAKRSPERSVLGIELKFKPLIQSIRRAVRNGSQNARILRYDAARLEDLFEKQELNNIYIHFPDPWSKKRQWKHRIIQSEFLDLAFELMRPSSFLDFKTDSVDYFDWAEARFHQSQFKVTRLTRDLHRSEWRDENFVTHFESLFAAQGLNIHYARLEKS